jgi:hypothetical protein
MNVYSRIRILVRDKDWDAFRMPPKPICHREQGKIHCQEHCKVLYWERGRNFILFLAEA